MQLQRATCKSISQAVSDQANIGVKEKKGGCKARQEYHNEKTGKSNDGGQTR